MRPWSTLTDGAHRATQPHLDAAGHPRIVYRVPGQGVHHGYDLGAGGRVGALLAGPGVDETGAQVPELLDSVEVDRRTQEAADQTAQQNRHDQAVAVVRALWQRCKPPAVPTAPAALTNREVAALLITIQGLK